MSWCSGFGHNWAGNMSKIFKDQRKGNESDIE